MITDGRHLDLITGASDSERSDTWGITMGPKTEDLVVEYRELRTKTLRIRSFPTTSGRLALGEMRSRATEIVRILRARKYEISEL